MPTVQLSKEELEFLIETVMYFRIDVKMDVDLAEKLADLHLKLEDHLEKWINGGVVVEEVPPHYKKLGVVEMGREYSPHPEEK